MEGYDKDGQKVAFYAERLESLNHLYGYYVRMMEIPDYDKALLHSTRFFNSICLYVLRTSRWRLANMPTLRAFFTRMLTTKHKAAVYGLSQIDFLQGRFKEASAREQHVFHGEQLVLSSHIALLNGKYDLAVELFEQARMTGPMDSNIFRRWPR